MTPLLTALLVVTLRLDIRIYDSVGVSAADLNRARAQVGAILASVGIEPIWRPCHQSTCAGPLKPHEVALRLVTSGPQSATDSLGFSAIDVSQRAGTLGTIYEDRVRALAVRAGVDQGDLLGRAIAHEIGHLLIGTASHSRFGLMRAVWASDQLKRGLPSDWTFSGREGLELRRQLAARTATAPPLAPVALSVDAVAVGAVAPDGFDR
jgi:hypothetical protein